jgi:hypothetical protein
MKESPLMVQEIVPLENSYLENPREMSDIQLYDALIGLSDKVERSVMWCQPQCEGTVYRYQEVYEAAVRVIGELESRDLVEVETTPRKGPYGIPIPGYTVDARDRDLHVIVDWCEVHSLG